MRVLKKIVTCGKKRTRAFAHERTLEPGMIGIVRAFYRNDGDEVLILRIPGHEYNSKIRSDSFHLLCPFLRPWERNRKWVVKGRDEIAASPV